MTTTVRKEVNAAVDFRSRQEEAIMVVLCELPEIKVETVCKLLIEYQHSTDDKRRATLIARVYDCIFRDRDALRSVPLEQLVDGGEAIARHRSVVASKVRDLRRHMGWSQQDLAERAGLPQSHISRIEGRKLVPTYKTIERLASAFEVRCSEIDPGFND